MIEKILKILNPLNILFVIQHLAWRLANARRRLRRVDYIFFPLPSELPPLPEQRGFLQRRLLGPPPLSLLDLDSQFRRIAQDPRTQGVVLLLPRLSMPLADLQSLRESILRLRAGGLRVLCYAHNYDMATYYVASAADRVLLLPGGAFAPVGLRRQTVFLRDALAALGLQVDLVAISPYKNSAEVLASGGPSPETLEQINWLLDSQYDILLQEIAAGRGQETEAVHQMIDSGPHLDTAAAAAGYVDALQTEEQLSSELEAKNARYWPQARRILLLPRRPRRGPYVALLPAAGLIIDGESGGPPIDLPLPLIGETWLGSETFVAQVRELMDDDRAEAVVLYVDSPGGSATASEAMAAALDELARTRPLVVFMGGVAASGGYYISTASRHIVARPGTITGSIGVWSAKVVASEAYNRLRFNALDFTRGANAGIFTPSAPFSEDQRGYMRASIGRTYELFVARVAAARGLSPEAVDAVGGGRVWTGQQALAHGLVDQLGGLEDALVHARELAGLHPEAPLRLVPEADKKRPPLPVTAEPAAGLLRLHTGLQALAGGRPQMLLPWLWTR